MERLMHAVDARRLERLEEARRVLALPISVSRLRWHPFGVFTLPLPRRTQADGVWSRRLHVWHPEGMPVGPWSAYGVHTHTGTGVSHVLVGSLQHHLYAFAPDADGVWLRRPADGGLARARLEMHLEGTTHEGTSHTFPAHHAHGVGKGPGLAVSLFEQREEGPGAPFTTWQRTDGPEEPLERNGPVPAAVARTVALLAVEQRLACLGV